MNNVHWLVHRFKSMNIAEIVWRIQQKFLQKREYRNLYLPSLPVTEIPLKEKLFASDEKIPLNRSNDNYSIFHTLDLFGTFDYSHCYNQWNFGFQTDNCWPEDVFSYNLQIAQREDIGDIRTNWELNRHFQFTCLAKNYYISGNTEYLTELTELFADWNKHNLFLHGPQWTSAMELGIRTVSWIYTYVFLSAASNKYGEISSTLLKELCHGIVVMTKFILAHRARFSSANNHVIVEMLAVGLTGVLFSREDWLNEAINVLTDELPRQNYKDGVNKEMSLHYQCFVMEAYGILWLTMENNNRIVPVQWRTYLTKMSQFVADCCGDYGETIVFGDNDEGKILDLQGKSRNYYRYVLQLMGILLDNRYTSEPLTETICWITSESQRNKYLRKPLYMSGLVSHYEEGGYTILRSRDHKVLIAMDHAQLGFGSIAAHAHCDALSIQMFYDGKPILIDPGTYNYHVPKAARNEFRKTEAHNTAYIGDTEQAYMLGPFLWGKRYQVGEVHLKQNDMCCIIDAQILYNGISHKREVQFDFNRMLTVVDETNKGVFSQNWNIDEGANCRIKTNGTISEKKQVISDTYNSWSSCRKMCISGNKQLKTIFEVS